MENGWEGCKCSFWPEESHWLQVKMFSLITVYARTWMATLHLSLYMSCSILWSTSHIKQLLSVSYRSLTLIMHNLIAGVNDLLKWHKITLRSASLAYGLSCCYKTHRQSLLFFLLHLFRFDFLGSLKSPKVLWASFILQPSLTISADVWHRALKKCAAVQRDTRCYLLIVGTKDPES